VAVAVELELQPGMYLSDGERLVQIKRVKKDYVVAEVEEVGGKVTTLSRVEIDERWWIVKPEKNQEETALEVLDFIEATYPKLGDGERSKREEHLLEACSCEACQRELASRRQGG
jgi:hypothetical protein